MEPLKYRILIGTGGIGTGIFFQLTGDHTLGRNESREGRLLEVRDFCKLHIISHYVAVLLCGKDDPERAFGVLPIGKIGADQPGAAMLEMMKKVCMDTSFIVRVPGTSTMFSVCFQYPDSSGGNITTAQSASSLMGPEDIRRALALFMGYSGRGMALAAPEVPLEARLELLKLAAEYDFFRFCAINSAEITRPLAAELLRLTNVLALNRDEAQTLAGSDLEETGTAGFLELVGIRLAEFNPDMRVCLTLGTAGAYGFESGRWEFTPAAKVEPVSTAGAGDATLAGLIVALAWGLPFIDPERNTRKSLAEAPIETALDFAALLASLSVLSGDTINLETNARTLYAHGKQLGCSFTQPVLDLLEVKE